jgi:hypothetical protein
MAFNGSGVFQRLYSWTNDALAGIKIRADRMDNEMNGMATGLSTCITKDGQTTITANLPMAGFRHTNVDDAVDVDDYASFGQVRNNPYYFLDTGAADAYVITPNPAFGSYTTGLSFDVKIVNANTGAATINVNGLGAKAIKKAGATLVAGELAAGKIVTVKYNGTDFDLIGGIAGGVVGASSSTDNAIARFDGATGKVIQNSAATIDDDGDITATAFLGKLNGSSTTATIASGVATLATQSTNLSIDTEGAAATDDLDTLTNASGASGDFLVIRTVNSARDVVVKNGTGNIFLRGTSDLTLASSQDRLLLLRQGGNYLEIARSQLGTNFISPSINVDATGTTSAGDINISGDYKINGTKLPYIQQVSTAVVATSTGATTIPFDDTIPQITEGNEFITVTITPTSATNILEIQFDCTFAEEANNDSVLTVAIFQDASAGAKYAKPFVLGPTAAMDYYPASGVFRMTAGTTSATTIRLRAGLVTGTVRINGSGGARKYGGVLASTMIVREVTS